MWLLSLFLVMQDTGERLEFVLPLRETTENTTFIAIIKLTKVVPSMVFVSDGQIPEFPQWKTALNLF